MLFYTEPRSARRLALRNEGFTLSFEGSLEGHPRLPRLPRATRGASRGRRRNSFAQRMSSPSHPRKSAVSVLPFILPSACPPGRAFCLFRLSPSRCAVEHPMKDASPACPVPDGEGVSRPKDLNVHVSLLECAVTQNATLSALECALTKTRPCKPFRMRSYEKRWGVGGGPSHFQFSFFQFPVPSRDHSPSLLIREHPREFGARSC